MSRYDQVGGKLSKMADIREGAVSGLPAQPAPINVSIIEDRREIRDALAILIGGTEGFRCAAAYRSMEEALDRIKRELPDVVLCDIGLPGMSGIEGIRILKERYTDLTILMLSIYDDDERIFDALCAGACGYLLKRTSPARLIESLKEAVDGGAPKSPAASWHCSVISSRRKEKTTG